MHSRRPGRPVPSLSASAMGAASWILAALIAVSPVCVRAADPGAVPAAKTPDAGAVPASLWGRFLGWFGAKGGARAPGGGKGGAQGARETPVVAARTRRGDMALFYDGLGSVTALNTVTVRSRVDGQIMRIAFKEGQLVGAGDLLAQIDSRPFEVQLEQAEGQMAKDTAQLKNAEADLSRYRKAADTVTQQQIATQDALVNQLRGTVKADQGLIDNAKLELTYSRITAPFTGRVGLRLVDAGNIIHANDPNGLAVLTEMQPITVVFNLPQDDIASIVEKMRATPELEVQAYDRELKKKLATGKLLALDNQVDPNTGTIKLKALFDNAGQTLFPNQFVNARLKIDTLRDATLIPSAAVQRGPSFTFCFLVGSQNTVGMRQVVLGPVEGDTTAVTSGLEAGDVVVTDGADKLVDGSRVAVTIR